MNSNYEDIINLPRPQSKHHKMSLEQRAAQFAPFAALVGFEESVAETERLTDNKIELENDILDNLNTKIQYIDKNIDKLSQVTITYFINDNKKSGGKYDCVTSKVKKIDKFNKEIILKNGKKICFYDIIDINF